MRTFDDMLSNQLKDENEKSSAIRQKAIRKAVPFR